MSWYVATPAPIAPGRQPRRRLGAYRHGPRTNHGRRLGQRHERRPDHDPLGTRVADNLGDGSAFLEELGGVLDAAGVVALDLAHQIQQVFLVLGRLLDHPLELGGDAAGVVPGLAPQVLAVPLGVEVGPRPHGVVVDLDLPDVR